jgi:hypothetical protein
VACSVLASCKDATAPSEPCEDDTGVALIIATSPEPRFSWTPACFAFRLGVSIDDSLGTIVWQIDADSGNTLRSGVTYGVVPDGATETVPAEALIAGQRYAVGLFRTASDTIPYDPKLLAALAFVR